MDQQICEKLEYLLKYIPFIDFVVDIDKDKYVKFVEIRKWIINKKRYPLSDLNKIEQSIITQYKNLIVLDHKKIPSELRQIFSNEFKHQFIDLCSDDEDNNAEAEANNSAKQNDDLKKSPDVRIESDDDLEIVSISYPVKENKTKLNLTPKHEKADANVVQKALDETSLLEQIDLMSHEDSNNPEPHNNHQDAGNNGKDLFQRRPASLFKRRNYFKSESTPTPNEKSNNKCKIRAGLCRPNVGVSASTVGGDSITLDSSDEETSHSGMDQTRDAIEQPYKKPSAAETPTNENDENRQTPRGLDNTNKKSSATEKPLDKPDESRLVSILSEVRLKSLNSSTSATSNNSNIGQSLKNTSANEKSSTELKNVSSIDLSSLENLNLEDLLSCIIKIDETNNSDLESLFLKTILRRLRSSSSSNGQGKKPDQCEAKTSPTLAENIAKPIIPDHSVAASQQPTFSLSLNLNPPLQQPQEIPPLYQPPYGYQATVPAYNESLSCRIQALTHKLNLNDPRIRNFLKKFKNSPLLTAAQRDMAAILGNFIPQAGPMSQPYVRPTMTNQPTPPSFVHHSQAPHIAQPSGQPYRFPSTPPQQTQMQNNCGTHWTSSGQQAITYVEYKRRKAEEQLRAENQLQENARKCQEEVRKRQDDEQRRQADEKKRRDDERKLQQVIGDIEKRDNQKKTDEIRHILLNTLQPYEGKIASMWESQKKTNGESAKQKKDEEPHKADLAIAENKSKVNKKDELDKLKKLKEKIAEKGKSRKHNKESSETKTQGVSIESGNEEKLKKPKEKTPEKDNSQKVIKESSETKTQNESTESSVENESLQRSAEEKNRIERVNRAIKELECTFKGYDQIQDYLPSSIGGKRRCSVHARSIIAEQLTSLNDTDVSLSQSTNGSPCAASKSKRRKTIDETHASNEKKRTSSVKARSAIAEQLTSSDDICSSQSTDVSEDSLQFITSKRRKTLDEHVVPSRSSIDARSAIAKPLNDQPDDDNDNSPSLTTNTSQQRNTINERSKQNFLRRQPKVVLRRLTEDQIRHHTKRCESNVLNVHLVESRNQPDPDTGIKGLSTVKKASPKTLNNDCEMTESNTKFCSLCSSRPSDLTSHYVRKHKSESYVSRLTWSQLDDLRINTRFAKAVHCAASRLTHYAVTCPFCAADLVEPFMNLYNHYSTHTGEYAFQCSGCQLTKPFRADIQSHQLHSKTCRGCRVQTMYLYPSNAMVIYLHYCTICNFVQLNEANILKHLRDHHDRRQSTTQNVQKCILTAMSDEPDTQSANEGDDQNQMAQVPRPKVSTEAATVKNEVAVKDELYASLDNDISVRNEACSEEPERDFDSVSCPLDEQLKQLHTEPSVQPAVPTTMLHLDPTNNSIGVVTPPRFASKHVPKIFKPEPIDIEEKCLFTPPRLHLQMLSSNLQAAPRTTYRALSSNVTCLGLYKCMADDCYYSTDLPNELLQHLEDHKSGNVGEYLQCAYCSIPAGAYSSPQQLVDHIQGKHTHMIYQCSVCCYRSCSASNVMEHQNVNHAQQACKVHKCSATKRALDEKYLKEKIAENVRKIKCPYCSHKSFYHSNLLEYHIKVEHKEALGENAMRYYSCIYCPLVDQDTSVIRRHLALVHPNELPYLCSHNNFVSVTEDILDNLQPIEINATMGTVANQESMATGDKDKSSAEELLKQQEEALRVRLRKLTEKTGVPPDKLYRCPEPSCGGFFSIYDLWLRHMRVKHHCTECRCPHCPTLASTRSLDEYKKHFEEHCRHTHICFHCPQTFANEQAVLAHALSQHIAIGPIRMEKIRFNLSYSYVVMIQMQLLTNRSEFVSSLLSILNSRLKDLDANESKKLRSSWLVSAQSSKWLDAYPKDFCRKLKKKCFNGNCDFGAKETEKLFAHVRENHSIAGSTFNCCQCDFNIQGCSHWDDVLNHIQQHSDNSFFICGACYGHHNSRSKLAGHVREMHAAQDVPIINLVKKRRSTFLSLAVVFANECVSFSTMRDCFCCEERDMNDDAFVLHLERYHKLVLNYFCEWCNLPIETRQAAEQHFSVVHSRNKLKIRCELSCRREVTVVSLHNLQVHIDGERNVERSSPVEPNPCNNLNNAESIVTLDDEIQVQNDENRLEMITDNRNEQPSSSGASVNTTNVLKTNTDVLSISSTNGIVRREARGFPRIKIVPIRKMRASNDANVLEANASVNTLVQCPPHSQIEIEPIANMEHPIQYTDMLSTTPAVLSHTYPTHQIPTHPLDPNVLAACQNSADLLPINANCTNDQVMYASTTTISTCIVNPDVSALNGMAYPGQHVAAANGITHHGQHIPQVPAPIFNSNPYEVPGPSSSHFTNMAKHAPISNFNSAAILNNYVQY